MVDLAAELGPPPRRAGALPPTPLSRRGHVAGTTARRASVERAPDRELTRDPGAARRRGCRVDQVPADHIPEGRVCDNDHKRRGGDSRHPPWPRVRASVLVLAIRELDEPV